MSRQLVLAKISLSESAPLIVSSVRHWTNFSMKTIGSKSIATWLPVWCGEVESWLKVLSPSSSLSLCSLNELACGDALLLNPFPPAALLPLVWIFIGWLKSKGAPAVSPWVCFLIRFSGEDLLPDVSFENEPPTACKPLQFGDSSANGPVIVGTCKR